MLKLKSAVFLDRDLVFLPVQPGNGHECLSMQSFQFKTAIDPETVKQIARLKASRLIVVVTTYQPLSSGKFSKGDLELMHKYLLRELPIDDIKVCKHDFSDRCQCRKPMPGLLVEASSERIIDLSKSFMVSGDLQDARAAEKVSCIPIMIAPERKSTFPREAIVLPNLASSVMLIFERRLKWREEGL